MKKLLTILSVIWLCGSGFAAVQIDFYYQPGCRECAKVRMLVLPRLEQRYGDQCRLNEFDIGIEANFLRLVEVQERLNASGNEPVSMVIGNRFYLGGFDAIDHRLLPMIEHELNNPLSAPPPPESSGEDFLSDRAAGFTLSAIAVAGLVDGVNPCVFATLVFFMSLLAISGVTGRKLLGVGVAYCTACFLSYLALGFGLFRVLKLFSGYRTIQAFIEYGMIAVLLVFAVLSLVDALRFRRSGKSSDVMLQLSDSIKGRIRGVMRRGLRARYLLPGAFATGVLVTALESVCTGQVYVPALVLMTRQAGGIWAWYLLLYNIMFILPLLAVFAVAWRGVSSQKLLLWSRQNVVWGKLSMAGLFSLLALLLWFVRR